MKAKILLFGLVTMFIAGVSFLAISQWRGSQNNFHWKLLTQAEPFAIHASPFFHVCFFDRDNGISLSAITIQATNDGGKTWTSVRNWDNKGFSSIVFTNRQNGWIVGSDKDKPLVLRTENGGLDWGDWKTVNFDEKSLIEISKNFTSFSDICFDQAGNSWIVGDRGLIVAVVNGQTLKTSSIFSTKEIIYSVSCGNSGEVWAVGENSAVFHYENGWVRKPIDKSYLFRKVASSGNDVWILGAITPRVEGSFLPGILLRSRDNGQTWENKTPNSAGELNDLFLKDGNGWLVGAGGSIYHSSDNGDSWVKIKSPTQNGLQRIFFLDSQNCWIVGDKATVLRLSNN